MDYEEARVRIHNPRFKASKKLGHKLVLYEVFTGTTAPNYVIKYFNTDILTFYPDGGVKIADGGFLYSQCTRQKINQYLPQGWRLETFNLRYYPRKSGAIISIHDSTWSLLRAFPYSSGIRLYAGGRPDYTLVNERNAEELKDAVAEYTRDATRTFLAGKMHKPNRGKLADIGNMTFSGDTVLIDCQSGEIVLTKQETPALASSSS